MKKPVILIGAGGHSKVLYDILLLNQYEIIGYTDIERNKNLLDVHYLGMDDKIFNYSSDQIMLVNGIGSTGDNSLRKKLYIDFKKQGYSFLSVIHPLAIIARNVRLGNGIQVMAGAIIQTGSSIGENTIINTRSSIDHDCLIGAHVHVAPGVTISGNVKLEDDVHIGTGSTLIQNVQIGRGSIVGAGAVVHRNVGNEKTVIGVPAREVIE